MSKSERLVIGTRASQLALTQTNAVAAELRRARPDLEIEVQKIRTEGDRDQRSPFSGFSSTGLFVKEIEQALLASTIDLAVHSMKDVPTEMDERLSIGAVPAREDARDALISREGWTFSNLLQGATVGTSSPRRRAALLRMRRDLQIKELRGNLDTRLRKLDEGQYDAIVLATAGLCRLGLGERVTEPFDIEDVVPAVGQGALAIQVRTEDARVREIVGTLESPAVRATVTAERAFLARLGGGCQMPVGAHGTVADDVLTLVGSISDPEGERAFRGTLAGDVSDGAHLGTTLAEMLLEEGAQSVLE